MVNLNDFYVCSATTSKLYQLVLNPNYSDVHSGTCLQLEQQRTYFDLPFTMTTLSPCCDVLGMQIRQRGLITEMKLA